MRTTWLEDAQSAPVGIDVSLETSSNHATNEDDNKLASVSLANVW